MSWLIFTSRLAQLVSTIITVYWHALQLGDVDTPHLCLVLAYVVDSSAFHANPKFGMCRTFEFLPSTM